MKVMYAMLSGWEIALIVLLVIILFGVKKIPALARSIGESIQEFRKGAHDGDQVTPRERKEKSKSEIAQK